MGCAIRQRPINLKVKIRVKAAQDRPVNPLTVAPAVLEHTLLTPHVVPRTLPGVNLQVRCPLRHLELVVCFAKS